VFKLLIVFGHLLAVCLAVGTVLLTDLRLLRRAGHANVVIAPPSRFESRVVGWSLLVMCATGVALIGLDLDRSPGPLDNPKLHGKLLLVAVLMLNAWVLHRHVFPWLQHSTAVSRWTGGQRWFIALTVGLSNSLWLFCAFLGIARPWNHSITLGAVLGLALGLWVLAALVIRGVLALTSREAAFEPTQLLDPAAAITELRRGGGRRWKPQPSQARRTGY
jgi:hypothetical protein